jgi:hypothetical protein
VTEPLDPPGLADDLAAEVEELLAGHALAARLADVLAAEVLTPARELFGDRAVPWIAGTLRTTAEVLERMGDG